jgi:hypothetical protein
MVSLLKNGLKALQKEQPVTSSNLIVLINQFRDCDDVSGVAGGGGGGSSNWRIDSDITVRTPRRR